LLDKGLLETFGPHALTKNFSNLSVNVSALTSGYIFHYSFLIIFGVSGLLLLNFFILESKSFELLFVQVFFVVVFITRFRDSIGSSRE